RAVDVLAERAPLEVLEHAHAGVGRAGTELALVLDRREPAPQVDRGLQRGRLRQIRDSERLELRAQLWMLCRVVAVVRPVRVPAGALDQLHRRYERDTGVRGDGVGGDGQLC